MSASQTMHSEENENLSDSDSSEATAVSSNEWPDEKDFETTVLLDQKLRLPKDLCEKPEIFNELFSMSTWNQLSEEEKTHLSSFLPTKFPENQEQEKQKTIKQLFNNEISRFGATPLNTFFNNLQDGNYRPDIAHYRKQIRKAEEREHRLFECERISVLAEQLVFSRDKLLRSAYKRPGESNHCPRKLHKSINISGSAVKANKRYLQELKKISDELNYTILDGDVIRENHPSKPKEINETQIENPEVGEIRFMDTLSTNKRKKPETFVSNESYMHMLKGYKKRKLLEPNHPEMNTRDIKVKEILSRANISRKGGLKKSTDLLGSNGSLIMAKPEKQRTKISKAVYQEKRHSRVQSEETDEEDWIKANIIKIEPEDSMPQKTKAERKPHQVLKAKTVDGNVIINRKRAIVDSEPNRAGKKIIVNTGGVLKSSFVTKINQGAKQISNKMIASTSYDNVLENSEGRELKLMENPELKLAKQSCFLSLIRNIFCSTPDHRMKLEELRRRINLWLKNPAASENTWYKEAAGGHWNNLLISAVHFLSGEFNDQPEGFVPYLEFKSHLNIYQWIGAGRDNDHRMVNLNQYWLSRQNEMGVRNKTKLKVVANPENNEDNYLLNSVAPSRCRSEWKVRMASKEEINSFQAQEKKRFESPFKSFKYREHDYESVVGPVRNIHSTQTSIAKTRDNNVLKSERPSYITTTALVRDAIARLPNGEGTRAEICELLKSSQYVQPHIFDTALQSIVESALNMLCAEIDDPCVKFDAKRKVWIYVHRSRSMEEFDRLHQQQAMIKKRFIGKKPESQEAENLNESKVIRFENLNKSLATTSDVRQKIRIQSSPPPLKISTPSRIIRHIQNPEPFDAEASLDAIGTTDTKSSRITIKNLQQIPSIVRAQSPKVTTIMGQKKIVGKPILINQNQSPTVSISGQSLTTVNVPSTSKIITTTTTTQGKNIIKLQNANVRVTKPVGSPQPVQQKIILTAATSNANKTGKIITFPRNSTPMLSQQKQILTNVIVQQQKAKSGQNQILLTANNQQKIPSLTISSPGTAGSSGSPQQRQAILQLKQLKESVPTTVVLKPQTNQTSLVGVNKLVKAPSQQVQQSITTSIQKTMPEVTTARLVSNVGGSQNIGTTFKLAQVGISQGNIIQITSVPQSSIPTSITKFTTTQASNTPIVATSTAQNIIITNNQAQSTTSGAAPTIKLQGGSFTAQQLLNARFINVQTLNNKGIKTTGGIKMINTQGYSRLPGVPIIITGNKNLNSNSTPGQSIVLQANPNSSGAFILNQGNQLKVQGNILTHGNVNILNNQGISTSQPQTVVLGNQVLKVQPLNTNGPTTSDRVNQEGKPTVGGSNQIILGSTLKVIKNAMKPTNAPQRVVLTSPSNSSQPMQQIILPANFQGLKTLQGIKVIQQARLIPTSTISSSSDAKPSTTSAQDTE